MGLHTTIFGYILDLDFWPGPIQQQVRQHNSNIIGQLPKGDTWPPVSKEMFGVTVNLTDTAGPNFEYFGRVIHFGASLKGLDNEWDEWLLKFEKLLSNLYFLEAQATLVTEFRGIIHARWEIDLNKYNVIKDGSMPNLVQPHEWKFSTSEVNLFPG